MGGRQIRGKRTPNRKPAGTERGAKACVSKGGNRLAMSRKGRNGTCDRPEDGPGPLKAVNTMHCGKGTVKRATITQRSILLACWGVGEGEGRPLGHGFEEEKNTKHSGEEYDLGGGPQKMMGSAEGHWILEHLQGTVVCLGDLPRKKPAKKRKGEKRRKKTRRQHFMDKWMKDRLTE